MKRPAKVTSASKLAEYERWLEEGATTTAIVTLGEALRCEEGEARAQLVATMRSRVPATALAEAGVDATDYWRRSMRIMSIGTEWDEDELLLVLTFRMNMEAILDVLKEFGIEAESIDLGQVDAELRRIATTKENRRAYARAISMLRKNSDWPRLEEWLASRLPQAGP